MKNHQKFVPQDASFLTVKEVEESLELEDQLDAPVIILAERNAGGIRLVRSTDANLNRNKLSGADIDIHRIIGYARNPYTADFYSDGLEINFRRRKVLAHGREVQLTPNEFELLRHLVADQGHPIEHHYLLRAIWGQENPGEIESLRVLINQLRKKIERDPANPKFIHTVSRIGYRFEPTSCPPKSRRSRAAPQ